MTSLPGSCRAQGLVLVLVGLWGCRSDGASDDGHQGQTDASTNDYPTCVRDCFPRTTCSGGLVRSYPGVALSCSTTEPCPSSLPYACAQGCAVEGASVSTDYDSAVFCAETPGKRVGDACQNNRDCLPIRAESQPDGTLTTIALRCDVERHACVETTGVSPSAFGNPCDSSARIRDGDGEVPNRLGGGACLVFTDAQAGCIRSGTTEGCTGDQECPSGWYCEQLSDLSTPANDGWPVCRPGPRGSVPKSLACIP